MGGAPRQDRAAKLGLAAHGLVEADLYGLCRIAGRWRSHSGAGARCGEVVCRTARCPWIWHRDDRYRFRSGAALQSAVSRPFLHAWQRPVWAAVPHEFGSAAAQGRRHHRGAAEDQAGVGQSIARSGAGGGRQWVTAKDFAVVTGGSTGIGAEICRQMLEAGSEVISLARRKPAQSHARLHAVEVDLMDRSATERVAAYIAARFPISHIVHNAGVIRPALLPDVEQKDLQALTQLHLGAALTLVQAALPAMKRNHFGRIVLMSSRGALGLQTRSTYSATKAAMIGMARTWALELAPDGITVNVVAPGPIADTEMFRSVVAKDSEREKALAAASPVKRLGRSDDVARAVMFFCGRANGFVTGQTLYVCGGASVVTLAI